MVELTRKWFDSIMTYISHIFIVLRTLAFIVKSGKQIWKCSTNWQCGELIIHTSDGSIPSISITLSLYDSLFKIKTFISIIGFDQADFISIHKKHVSTLITQLSVKIV